MKLLKQIICKDFKIRKILVELELKKIKQSQYKS